MPPDRQRGGHSGWLDTSRACQQQVYPHPIADRGSGAVMVLTTGAQIVVYQEAHAQAQVPLTITAIEILDDTPASRARSWVVLAPSCLAM
jgi:hypothetical protein